MADETILRVTGEHRTTEAVRTCLTSWKIVGSANGIAKRYLYSLPDPFAVLSVDDTQIHTTVTAKKTLNPAWNDTFDV